MEKTDSEFCLDNWGYIDNENVTTLRLRSLLHLWKYKHEFQFFLIEIYCQFILASIIFIYHVQLFTGSIKIKNIYNEIKNKQIFYTVFNLANKTNVEETKKKVDAYKKEHEKLIRRNNTKIVRNFSMHSKKFMLNFLFYLFTFNN